jgi:hypothetical protein
MAAAKGTRPPRAGKGRRAGSQNKITKALKEMILDALEEAGGQDYLVSMANAQPAAFLALLGKVLPTTLAGDPKNPPRLIVTWLTEPEDIPSEAKVG